MRAPLPIATSIAFAFFLAMLTGATVYADTTVLVQKDSYIKSGQSNKNEGANHVLRVDKPGKNRTLVSFGLAGIDPSEVVSATLELTVSNSISWGSGRPVNAHRVIAPWNEGNGWMEGNNIPGSGSGVTWNCASDADVANDVADCAPQWGGGAFAPTATASTLHTNGMTGVVRFDVTADVAALSSGAAEISWILKKQDEMADGRTDYISKERAINLGNPGLAPRLVLLGPPNRPPTATADIVVAIPGEASLIDVLANDFDPDGDALTLVAVGSPALIMDNKVQVTFAAPGNHVLEYTIQDADASPFAVSGTLVVAVGTGETLVLTAVADSFLKQGSPNENQGVNSRLHVTSSDRALTSFSLVGVETALVRRANLELRVVKSQTWGSAGRFVAVRRLLEPFLEGNGSAGPGVTWNCAVDVNIGNANQDCASPWSGGRFAMATAPPFLQKNTTTGVVRWDVTADLHAAGAAPEIGFLVKKVDEAADGLVHYDSRTSGGTPPRLVVERVHLSEPLPDITSPTVTAPANLIVAAADEFGAPRSSPGIAAFLSSATASDDVDPVVAVTHDAPDPFLLGTTVVTFYATDSSGNQGSDSASITVEDQTPPEVTPPISIRVNSPDGTPVPDTDLEIATFLLSARAFDNVDGFLPLSHDAPSQFFPDTTTLVTFSATDASGLTGQASAAVAVTQIIITPTPQSGQNVNMVSGQDFVTGDPFLQRQNEPSLAVSTRNTMHIVGGANDYRTVDVPGLLNDEVTGDAWLGVFKSFDGGERWISTLVPGFPQDTSAEGAASPLRGFQAGADPVVRSGAGGIFYYSGLVFNRGPGQPSRIFVARFVDNNNDESADAIRYVDASVVDSRPAGTTEFLDKPWMAVDIRRLDAQPCSFNVPQSDGTVIPQDFPGGNLYVAYAVVEDNGTQEESSRILFRRSTDCGLSWTDPAIEISAATSAKNQGATMAIDPRSGKLYVAWRRFSTQAGDTDAILLRASSDGGKTFGPVREVSALVPFDQQTVDQPGNLLRFRTNAYPTMAVDGDGRVYVAYSQRGFAPPTADARVVMRTSTDGASWTPPFAVDNAGAPGHQMMPTLAFAAGKLFLSYYDFREDVSGAFDPFVDDTPLNPERHSVDVRTAMAVPAEKPVFTLDSALKEVPSVRASKYIGSYNDLLQGFQQEQFNFTNLPLFRMGTAPFVGDYIDAAASPAFVPAGDGTWEYNTDPLDSPTFQLAWTDNRDVRPPPDGNWANYTPPNSDFSNNFCSDFSDAGMRDQNIYTARITEGLYVGSPVNTKPLVDAGGGPIQRSFILYVQNTTNELRSYRLAIANQPPDAFPAGIVGRASFKQFPLPPYDADSEPALTQLLVLVPARSSIARTVYVSSMERLATIRVDVLETAIAGTSFVPKLQRSVLLNPDLLNPDLLNPDLLNRETHNVVITSTTISNPDLLNPDLLNPDLLNPDLLNPDLLNPDLLNPDLLNPDLLNPDLLNPDLLNQEMLNPDLINPDLLNPDLINPDLLNSSLTDITYTIQNVGNTTTTYSFVGLLDQVPAKALKYQLLVYKKYTTPIMDPFCNLVEREHHELVANITGMRNPDLLNPDLLNPDLLNPDLLNPDLLNPDLLNPDLLNPDLLNPDLLNASIADGSFFLEPGQELYVTLRVLDDGVAFQPEDFTPVVVSQTVNTEEAEEGFQQPPLASDEDNPLSIFTPALPQGTRDVPYRATLVALGADGPVNWTGGLPPGLALDAASGQISGAPTTTGVFSVMVSADDGVEMDTKTLALEVTSNQLRFTVQPVSGDAGAALTPAVVVSIVDGAGNPVGTASDVVTLAIGNNNGAGALSGISERTAVGGVATFPGLSIVKAGSGYTLFATAPGLKSALSHPFDIAGTNPTRLGFLLQPASVTALQAFSVQVAVLDAFGNIRPGATDLVTLAIGANPGGGNLFGPSTAIAVNGVARFQDLGFSMPGTGYTLVASTAGLAGAVSNPFDVNAVPPAKLAFTAQPTNTDLGQPISPAVEVAVLDAADNPVTTATNQITLGISANPGGGNLSGTVTVEAVNGVASFPGLSIDQPGTGYSLVALSAGLTPATSLGFDVVTTGPFAYVGNVFDDSVSVIDLSTNSVVTEIPAGGEPSKILVSPDGNTVYVGRTDGELVIIDGTTNQIATSVTLDTVADPVLTPDGDTIYYSNASTPGHIHQFDTGSQTGIQSIGVDDLPIRLALTPFGRQLYVAHVSGALSIIDTVTSLTMALATGVPNTNALAISPDGRRGFMTDPAAGSVFVFNTATNAAVMSIPVGGSPQGLAFTRDGLKAYVPNGAGAGYVSVIDTATNTVSGNIVVGFTPRHAAVSPDGSHVYVTNQGSNSVSVIDTSTDSVVDTVNVGGGPSAIAIKPFEMITFVVSTVADGGEESLRQAFLDANANAGPDVIEFNIAGPGPHTISPTSALPTLSGLVLLDATTQPGYSGTPLVEIEGSSAGSGVSGIIIAGGSSLVRGLAVNRFEGSGIVVTGSGNTRIEGNFIGTDVTGSVDLGNGSFGVWIQDSQDNVVGSALLGNVISGNGAHGVFINGASAIGNLVQRNRIGTDASGSSAIANNGGVHVASPGNTVGGAVPAARNVISGNNGFGILLNGADNSVVQANFVGTDALGTSPLGNATWGLRIVSNGNTIGGPNGSESNVFSTNGLAGVSVGGSNNVIQNNLIGTDLGGTLNLGNTGPGVEIFGSDNSVGALTTNHIAHNSDDGITVLSGVRNALATNIIHDNGGLGIDLGGDGVTANDSGDGDTGANDLVNFPVLTSATTGALLTIQGTLNSTPNTSFDVWFYTSSVCDPSGNGEGETRIGSTGVGTGATGDAVINGATFPAVAAGLFVTAVVVDPSNNTSEFSACVPVTP